MSHEGRRFHEDLEPEEALTAEEEAAPATEMCANAAKEAQDLREILASLPRRENSPRRITVEDILHGNVENEGQSDNLKRLIASISNTKRKRSNTGHLDGQSASSPTPVPPARKRSKRPSSERSYVWKHFSTGPNDEDHIATCNYYGQVYACDRSTHGTSTLWYHLRLLCPKEQLKGQDLPKKNQGTPKHTFSIEDCRQALADMVIIDEMPFRSVEGEGFRRYSKVLQPKFDPPSRVTVARDCMARYFQEKPNWKKVLKNQRVSLTIDTWTSNQNLCYMSLTAHWIDVEWKPQTRILNFCSVSDHKGETLGKRVEECLLEWGIDNIFTITVNNASANDKLIQYLKGVCKGWKGVVLHNKFLHVRCNTHILNIVVKSGLEENNEPIDRIRIAVRFVRSSPSRLKVFKKCAELEKISTKSLLTLDLDTRWNSTYLMLESAVKFEKAFERLGKEYKPFKAHFGDKRPPNASDWEAARRMLCFLKLFEKVTTRLSASFHVTSSIVFHDIMLMRAKLEEIAMGEDATLASMARLMKRKFQKYWEEEGNLNYLLFIAVILDPRYKLQYLTYCLSILYGPDKGKEIGEKVESALAELFASYAQSVSASSSTSRGSNPQPVHFNVDEEDEENPWDMLASQFEQHMEEIESEPNISELSMYLSEKREMRAKEFEILNYWKLNSNEYPVLSLLAKDILAVPASTVPSESAFSTGGRIIDPLRCSLSTNTVEALICAQSWLRSSHTKATAREAAEEVQEYEEIREDVFLLRRFLVGDLLFSVAFSSPPGSGSSSPSGGLGFCGSICLHIHSPPVFLWHLFGCGCLVRGTGPALGLLAARHLSLRQSCLLDYGSTRLPAWPVRAAGSVCHCAPSRNSFMASDSSGGCRLARMLHTICIWRCPSALDIFLMKEDLEKLGVNRNVCLNIPMLFGMRNT
ncbi:hypothetical protein BS78_09G179200 [Paspalum vaginatum]|nr:hypothetical protein BS78_09G179200 [Paspalum vaginatum]